MGQASSTIRPYDAGSVRIPDSAAVSSQEFDRSMGTDNACQSIVCVDHRDMTIPTDSHDGKHGTCCLSLPYKDGIGRHHTRNGVVTDTIEFKSDPIEDIAVPEHAHQLTIVCHKQAADVLVR